MATIEILGILGVFFAALCLFSAFGRLIRYNTLHKKAKEGVVFIIDKSRGIRYILQTLLGDMGLIIPFSTLKEAEIYLEKGIIPSLMLIDVKTAEADTAILETLASKKSIDSTRFIAFSNDSNLQLSNLKMNFEYVFSKPFVLQEIQRIVKHILLSNSSSAVPLNPDTTTLLLSHLQKPVNVRRILDVIIALSLLVLLAPIFVLIIIAIKIDSKGPVFYLSKRAGRGYKIFSFYKFRTMVINADAKMNELAHLNQYDISNDGPRFFKIQNDPRITKVGEFLRKTSLDELPQLINVLLGDMTLVGNRPLPLYEASTLLTDKWSERFLAPAGIVGLWQLSVKRRQKDKYDPGERLSIEIQYASKRSWFVDLWIFAGYYLSFLRKKLFSEIFPMTFSKAGHD